MPPSSFSRLDTRKTSGKEKRQLARKKVSWRTTIRTRDKRVLIGQTENVSPNGVLVSLKTALKMEDLVFVEIDAFFHSDRLLLQAIAIVKAVILTSKGYNNHLYLKTPTEITTQFLTDYVAAD